MRNQKFQSQHQFYNHNHHKNTFFPMLCSKLSIKEVNLPICRINQPSCNDPLSPKIGCMGQVKRNNKISGFPTSQYKLLSFNNKSSIISPSVKYNKLKKLFSGKNLINTPSVASCTTTLTKQRVSKNVERCCVKNENVVGIKIDEMDPPLPVIKKVNNLEEENKRNNLWKRRSGSSLKSLQLQEIQVQNSKICLLQPTTV